MCIRVFCILLRYQLIICIPFARLNGVLPQPLTETLISVVPISMFLYSLTLITG